MFNGLGMGHVESKVPNINPGFTWILLFVNVFLVTFLRLWQNTLRKSILGDKGFILLTIPGSNPSLRSQSKNLKYHSQIKVGQRSNTPMDLIACLVIAFLHSYNSWGPSPEKMVPITFKAGLLALNYNQGNPPLITSQPASDNSPSRPSL